MMNHIFKIILFFLPCIFQAQINIYVMADLEGGILNTDYTRIDNLDDNIIDGENAHYNLKGSLGFMMEGERLSASAGLSQSLRFWELEGVNHNNQLKVKNTQSFPTIYLGGYYQIPVNRTENLNIYVGSRFGIDFMQFDILNERSGVVTDYVEGVTDETKTIAFNIIPEVGIKRYFESGNFWKVSARYNLPINGNIVEGVIHHFRNQTIVETIKYNASGQYIALGLTYGFQLNK